MSVVPADFVIVDVHTAITHNACVADMRQHGPSKTLCGGEFFWANDKGVVLPEPTIFFRGVIGCPNIFPVTCIECLAWQSS